MEEQGTWAAQKHSEAGDGRPLDRGVWTANTVKRPRPQPAHPQYANYWAPLTRKRHTMPHSAQSQHANYWAPRTRKRHQQVHRPQWPTESSDPTQHTKGRTGDRRGPLKGATTRRNVTQGVGGGGLGGVGGFGGGDGLCRPCGGGGGGGGGVGFLPRGITASSLSEPDSKANRSFERLFEGGWGVFGCGLAWGGFWRSGGGRPPPSPPSSSSLTPPPPMLPHNSSPSRPAYPPPASVPTRWAESDTASPKRRSPHAKSPSHGDRTREQGPRVGHDAVEGPHGYFLGSLSVSPGHLDGPGMRRLGHDRHKKKQKKCELIFLPTFLIFDININFNF